MHMKSKFLKSGKSILKLSLVLLISLVTTNCSKDKDSNPAPAPSPQTSSPVFNTNDYAEYLVCQVGDYKYSTGNKPGISTSAVYAFKVGPTLYLTTNDGNFISGSTQPMQIHMQLKNFDAVNLKSYEVSGTYPAEIKSYKHISGERYDTNNGVNTTPQSAAITITKIENGFYTGTFSFMVYKENDRAKTLQVSQGMFKFKL